LQGFEAKRVTLERVFAEGVNTIPMFVSGFTFVRNAIIFDYPVVESINSLLPICDEVVVAVGQSDDGTLELIRQIASPKLRIIETNWDTNLQVAGRVLAAETEKALAAVQPHADWCFYLQADEVLHEADYPLMRQAMFDTLPKQEVEALLFDYIHFYGAYQYVGTARHWYRREVRVIRNHRNVRSWKDAQGFRTVDGKKLKVVHSGARVYHYGWVRHPEAQKQKHQNFHTLYHGADAKSPLDAFYQYEGREPIKPFLGTHPAVMKSRIAARQWHFEPESVMVVPSVKERLSAWFEQLTGWRVGEYRNYRLLRSSGKVK
jgi:glycosyltransferase involved in cell wall biosynthesis